ncbi:MAG: AEC family transporter [Halorhodospira halophila]|uniref:AEC family transporter n=1 Tax=Halorhodospira halophila TaxID=1053 RepID=UPI0026EA786A|nr:AEC family transporter [Halorhodospira halophila]MCC3751306.1 AEC family transporter [Halorhodospira halophila]
MAGALASALAAVFGLIALGHVLRRQEVVPPLFWDGAERLTYYFALPALLVVRLAEAPLREMPLLPVVAILAGGVAIAGALLLLARPLLEPDGPGFTSALQGTFRPNTYVGLATAAALFGTEGVTLAAISLAVLVPLVNLLAVAALIRYGRCTGRQAPGFWASLARNPLVLACLLGVALSLLPVGLPAPLAAFLDALGQAALPLGLMAVGAGLYWGQIGRHPRLLIASSAIKLLLLPAGVGAVALAAGLDATTGAVLVLFAGVPASASCYILARQLGGDAPLMASILTVQTVTAVATLPLVVGGFLAIRGG